MYRVVPSLTELFPVVLQEVEEVRQRYLAGEDAALRHLAGLKPGDAAVGRTASAHPDAGADVDVRLEPHGLRAVVPAFHRGRQPLKADELVAGCILHVPCPFPSFISFVYRVLPSFTELYRVFYRFLPSFTKIYRVSSNFTEFSQVLPSFTEFYRVTLGYTDFYQALLSFTVFYRVFPIFTYFYRVLPSFSCFFF